MAVLNFPFMSLWHKKWFSTYNIFFLLTSSVNPMWRETSTVNFESNCYPCSKYNSVIIGTIEYKIAEKCGFKIVLRTNNDKPKWSITTILTKSTFWESRMYTDNYFFHWFNNNYWADWQIEFVSYLGK